MTAHKRGGIWVVVQMPMLTLAFTLPVTLHLLHRTANWPSAFLWLSRGTGLAALIGSTILFVASKRALGPYLVPYPLPLRGAPLRRDGVYARVRHPMYLAIMIGTSAWALIWSSPPGLGLSAACIVFFMLKSRYEEHLLRAMFPEYAAYSQVVPRLLPRFTPKSSHVP